MVRAPAHLMRESDRTPRPRPVSPAGRGFCCVFFYVLVILRSALARVSKDEPQAGTIILRGSPQVRLAPQDDDSAQSCILEKSATARVAARIWFRSFRRFSRTFGSSSLTITLSKNASTAGRSFAIALIALAKSSFATAALASAFTCSIALASVFSSERL